MSNMKRFLSVLLCALLGLQLCLVAGASPFKPGENAPAGGVDEEVFYLDGVIINAKAASSVSYRTDVTIVATATNVPDHLTLAVYEGGTLKENGTNKSVTYRAGEMTRSKSFTIKLIDVNKTVQKRSDGSEITAPCDITVNGGFFARIIAFFRSLFGTLPKEVIEQKPSYRECTLYFDANGGTDAPESYTGYGKIELTYGWPERSGFEFLGWALSPYATQAQYQGGDIFNLTADTTLFAVWRIYSTIEEIVSYYNHVRRATDPAPEGHQTMALDGEITGDGTLGPVISILEAAAKSTLEKNSKDIDRIPASDHADIRVSDVKSAKMEDNGNGSFTITINLKDQKDGPDGDYNDEGPVSHGIGTLGSIDNINDEIGATITEGRDTVELSYTDAYIKATIKDGKIESGTWHYKLTILIGEVKAKLGIIINLKNIKATIDYEATI